MRGQDEQLQLRLREYARRADRSWSPVCGRFVTGAQRAVCMHEARQEGVAVSFYGGWEDAERVQPCFYPMGDEPEYTGQWVKVSWNPKFESPEHRDLLGSLMGLGIERNLFGDLVVQEGTAWVYALPQLAARLPQEWQSAGRFPIRVSIPQEPPVLEAPKGQERRDTVASLRLDCILQSGLNMSRTKAAQLVRQGLVMVDHMPQERVDHQLKEGTLLSIRGYGRIRLLSVGEPTRKDRLPVTLELWLTGH